MANVQKLKSGFEKSMINTTQLQFEAGALSLWKHRTAIETVAFNSEFQWP